MALSNHLKFENTLLIFNVLKVNSGLSNYKLKGRTVFNKDWLEYT